MGVAAKLEAFAMLNGITAAFALQEQSDPALQQRNAAYLAHAITSGEHPRLAELLSREPQQLAPDEQVTDRYPDIMARILTALLGPRVLRPRRDEGVLMTAPAAGIAGPENGTRSR
ncbi:MAG: Transcriptional regulator, tetR family [Actinomycetia bacterium]|nr:Transcriptional regulator, tetR family [Actinomycetes bacterium]